MVGGTPPPPPLNGYLSRFFEKFRNFPRQNRADRVSRDNLRNRPVPGALKTAGGRLVLRPPSLPWGAEERRLAEEEAEKLVARRPQRSCPVSRCSVKERSKES